MAETEIPNEDKLAQALQEGDAVAVESLAAEIHPADLANFARNLDEESRQWFFSSLEQETVAQVMECLTGPEAEKALTEFPEAEQQEILESLPDDELVDLLQEADSPRKERYLSLLSEDKKALSSDLLKFPEESAGGRMTTAFAAVRENMTIREAIDALSENRESTEILSRIFVIDEDGLFLGKVRLRDLTFNPRSMSITEVMDDADIYIDALADQEEAAQMISRYDLVALPVVDRKRRLIGVITHDDALEIIEEESTEDIEKFSAISGEHGEMSYLLTPVPTHFRRRFFWILPLALLAILSGIVIYSYEKVLNEVYLLVIYLPMVVAAGGNTGSQSATTVIRAMSLGEFTPDAFARVVWKELRIGMLMGGLLGICIALVVGIVMPHLIPLPDNVSALRIAGTVGLALTGQVASSTLLGAVLPLLARAARLDPAVVASPAITTIVDVTGMAIYLGLGKVLLGI
ncbi:MAG: magnesium transporter [Verrucomicrobiales bacterium]